MMNKKFAINNFRVFKDKTEFEFRPFTILTGTNSSGKSSLFKAIKLLAKNFNSFDNNKVYAQFNKLEFQDEKQQLGGFNKVNSKFTTQNELEFSTNFYSELWGELNATLIYEKAIETNLDNGKLKEYILKYEESIIARASYSYRSNVEPEDKDALKFNTFYGDYIQWSFKFENKDLWIKKFYSLNETSIWQVEMFKLLKVLNESNYSQIRKNNFEGLNSSQKRLLKDCFAKGLTFDSEITPETVDEITSIFKKGAVWNVLNKEGLPIAFNRIADELYIKKDAFTDILFPFEFIKELVLELGIRDFKSVDYNLFSSVEEKQRVYMLTEMLIKSNIENVDELKKTIINYEKKYIKNSLLKTFSTNPRPKIFDRPEDKNENFSDLFPKKVNSFTEEFDNPFFEKNEIKTDILKEIFETEKNRNGNGVKETIGFIDEIIDREIKSSLEAFTYFGRVEFIDSDRADIKRLFFDNNPSNFGHILNDFQKLTKDFINERIPFINKWIKEFNIASEFILERDQEGLGSRPYLIVEGEKVLLADLGYGINQLFPIILRIASLMKGMDVFIEEPESNLHPAYQSKLAELFADAYHQFDMHFIIESHSEYLIRKFQFLVANSDHGIKNKDIAIYYLYHPDNIPEGKKQVELLEINNDGSLDGEFGTGFFDEASNWKMELMRLKHGQKN